jgi:hypothetical protein
VAVGAAGSGTVASSGSVTTTNANDLLVGANIIVSSFAAVGTGYTASIIRRLALPCGRRATVRKIIPTSCWAPTSRVTCR